MIIVLPFLSQFTGENPPKDVEFLVPETVDGLFKQWTLGSNRNKCLAVNNMQDKRLTVKESRQDTQPFTTIFLMNGANIEESIS